MKCALLAAILALYTLSAGCGTAATCPDPPTCATPTPLPITPGRGSSNPYFTSVRVSVDRVASLREQLRAAYPGDKFSRSSQFRVDFATYADTTACVARTLKDLKPTTATFEQYDADLDAAVQALIEHTALGRDAVRRRNVSDYRVWYSGVDLKIAEVRTASNAPRQR